MKTKTLLIAAAALAVGVISSEAQVYSQNVVGYINQPIPAGGYQIVGSQLINGSDANQTNGDVNTTLVNGLISSPANNATQDPSLSSNSVLYAWSGTSYSLYYYFNAADATAWESATSPAGWYDGAGIPASVHLNNGKAAFIQNHSSFPMTITTTGNVLEGTNVSTIISGYNLIALQVPISTNPAVALYGLPGNLNSQNPPSGNPAAPGNDVLYAWNGTSYSLFYYFNAADATAWEGFAAPAGFYDGAGNPMPASSFPQVNQGFFLLHSGSALNWTNSFTAQ